ncbi:nucleotide-binding universal stress UspA family protein [Thermocatellispora tengchongensis]|uniref:Nucleotide-binding universal stress UspA family protein n=2 Tax=Thermocatellispora tengchongensis TaxID=1073253 RepID=A0A840PFI9_9ACTN|nr:universal stress protein [Thermocatellispora tengchongensis]MBB5140184.1 nucleotide-binding universal stress UspA family protein [Thermocatellispora tengchongensis]
MIVVGTDGSRAGLRAVEWAAREAMLHRVTLRVVHAMPAWAHGMREEGRYAEVGRWMRDNAAAVVSEAVTAAHAAEPEADVSSAVVPGDPRSALIEASRDAELLVVGNHGLGGFRGLLVGSAALGVAAHAACDVAVVRELPSPVRREVVAAVDGSPRSDAVLARAFAEADLRGAGLHIVHARARGGPARSGEDRIARMLSEITAGWRERYPDLKPVERVVTGHPVDVLRDACADAELLVVGSHGYGDFRALVLGSVSHAMLHHAPCPVIVTRARTNGTS